MKQNKQALQTTLVRGLEVLQFVCKADRLMRLKDVSEQFAINRSTKYEPAAGEFLSYDLAQNAESLGAKVHKVVTPEQLRTAMAAAQQESGPSVVTIEIEPYKVSVGTKHSFWDIAPPEVSTDPKAQELRKNYEKRRDQEQRFYL